MDYALLHPPRRLQQVSTIATRKTVITWMVQDELVQGFPSLYKRTIEAFSEHFQSQKAANVVQIARC